MTSDPSRSWRTAVIVVALVGIVLVGIAAASGGPLAAVAVLGWVVALDAALVVGWRLRRRTWELVEVCRAFGEGDYQRRAAMPEGALQTLGMALNGLGERLQSAAQALARSHELLDAALGALEEGVACVDHLDRIVYANRTYRQLLDIPEDAERTLYADIGDVAVSKAVAAARAGEQAPVVPITVARHRLHVKAVAGNDDVVVLIFYDRTSIERLEMRRRDFMSAVSHELKTPLTSILGFAETALEDEAIDLETTRNFFERIVHHAERLSLLVRDIITLSRLEEGEWAIRPENVDLVHLAADLVDDIQDAAGKSRVSLVLQAPPKMPAYIDPELIRMLLSNLMSNAIRYNRPDGTVWVRLSEDPGSRLRLEVQDTGIGIPPEHQERIFERFYRVDSHRSRQSGGTGLGLSIVKHLLQRLDGRLELQSSSAGTRFVILLPYIQAGTGGELSGQAGPRR